MKKITAIESANELFAHFADALSRLDTKTMAYLYAMPCTLLSDDSTTVFSEPAKLEGFFNRGAAVYRQLGVAQVRCDIWSRQAWTDKMALVKVKWHYLDKSGNGIYSCDYQYIIKLNQENRPGIVMSVSINEKERMAERANK